jgi:WD40 repeat protein
MRLWDIASGKEIRRLNADTLPVLPSHTQLRDPPGDIQRVTFAPDGRHVLFGGANGLLGLWDVDTGRVARRFVGHTIYVDGVAVSRDGKRVLSAGTEGTVRLWDMATGKELQRMAGHTDAPASVAFSSDGTRALSGSRDHTMRLWDLRKGEQIGAPFPGHPHMVLWTVVFLPDGQQAISCDSTIRLWDLTRDLPTGRQLRTFDAHTAPVLDVALSSDGRRILSGSVDGTARLWDRFTGREIATLVGHRNWIQAVALTPDGRFALTSGGAEGRAPPYRPGNDFALRLWRLP